MKKKQKIVKKISLFEATALNLSESVKNLFIHPHQLLNLCMYIENKVNN